MNPAVSRSVVEAFLQGSFDVFGALFSLSFGEVSEMFDTADIRELTPPHLQELLSAYPVVMRAEFAHGGGAALLFSARDAARFLTLSAGGLTKQTSSGGLDLAALKDIAATALGGGVNSVMNVLDREPEQLENVQVTKYPDSKPEVLLSMLGPGAVATIFTFSAPPVLDAGGALLLSKNIESGTPMNGMDKVTPFIPPKVPETVPEKVVEKKSPDLAAGARLSEAEMNDILSGFSPEAREEKPVAAKNSHAKPAPANLDIVLDIRLVATARLGRIEMPIGDILALGPGSIVEVGHLVDEPIELLVNDKLIARGDVVVVDEKFGLRITEIVSPLQRIESLH